MEFLSADLPNGLNTDFKTLWNLCSDHPDVQALLDEVTATQHGGDRKSEEIKNDNVNLDSEVPNGNSRAYGIRKLRKYAPELLDRVTQGDLTVHAALIR